MSLVAYNDSEESPPPSPKPKVKKPRLKKPTKRKRELSPQETLPSLPSSFHNLYATKVRNSTSDDPALHNGRQRATPHKPGNWPSHIYIEWIPSSAEVTYLEEIVSDHNANDSKTLHSLLRSELGAPLPLHVSLSQSLSLTSDQREPFATRLGAEIARAGVAPFKVRLLRPKTAANFSESRYFLVLPLEGTSHGELPRLLEACNSAAEGFGLPLLYAGDVDTGSKTAEGSMFHVSIAWSLKGESAEGGSGGVAVGSHVLDGIEMTVDTVKAKIGNTIHDFELGRL